VSDPGGDANAEQRGSVTTAPAATAGAPPWRSTTWWPGPRVALTSWWTCAACATPATGAW